jgi:hypothetical protein
MTVTGVPGTNSPLGLLGLLGQWHHQHPPGLPGLEHPLLAPLRNCLPHQHRRS